MDLNSPLFDKIRSKKKGVEQKKEASSCQHEGCTKEGKFRAPKGRDMEGEFFCFCIEHVRQYNQSYNYFSGMNDDAVANQQKEALTGNRPTWAMNPDGTIKVDGKVDAATFLRARLERLRKVRATVDGSKKPVNKAAKMALEALGLDAGADKDTIRARFKDLAKRLHPDLNEGDRSREEKLRAIIAAYNHLKSAGLA